MQNHIIYWSWLDFVFHISIAYLSTPPLRVSGTVWNGACLYAELYSVSLSLCHYGEVSSRETNHLFLKI